MTKDTTKPLDKVIRIDQGEIRGHLNELVHGTVEETLNELLDAEADEMCRAQRYERSPDRVDTRAGHYKRKLHTQAGVLMVIRTSRSVVIGTPPSPKWKGTA